MPWKLPPPKGRYFNVALVVGLKHGLGLGSTLVIVDLRHVGFFFSYGWLIYLAQVHLN